MVIVMAGFWWWWLWFDFDGHGDGDGCGLILDLDMDLYSWTYLEAMIMYWGSGRHFKVKNTFLNKKIKIMGDLLKVLKEQKLVSDEKLAFLHHNFMALPRSYSKTKYEMPR